MSAFITIEGVEGAGKTTQAARLADALRESGETVLLTREPGATELGRSLRRLLLDDPTSDPARETELLLYLADRAEHVQRKIRPALDRGEIVIADRFSDSTVAYQIHGRGLPDDTVRRIDEFARGGLMPHRTFVLDLPIEEGLARAKARGEMNRMDREAVAFHERVREGFRAIARAEPKRVELLDARADEDTLAQTILDGVRAILGRGRAVGGTG